MYLSNRDLHLALDAQLLVFNPPPAEIDTTSIDLHLDTLEEARVWDVDAYQQQQSKAGNNPAVLGMGRFDYKAFASKFTVPVPSREDAAAGTKVYRDSNRIILEPGGFFLWQTREEVGTPEIDPRLICFVDGKSGRARTGLLVHMIAPTIHAGWWGKVTLEIANLGPFHLALQEGDAIAQIVVAAISSPPTTKKRSRGVSIGQQHVTGGGASSGRKPRSKPQR